MPFGPDDTPKGTEGLPAKARRVFKAAFNSAYKKYNGSEERAHKIAWAAVKNAGYRKKGDAWVARDWDPDQPREPEGSPEGGQWTSGGGGGGEGGGGGGAGSGGGSGGRESGKGKRSEGAPPKIGTKEWEKKADKYYREQGKSDPKLNGAYQRGKREPDVTGKSFFNPELQKAFERGQFIAKAMKAGGHPEGGGSAKSKGAFTNNTAVPGEYGPDFKSKGEYEAWVSSAAGKPPSQRTPAEREAVSKEVVTANARDPSKRMMSAEADIILASPSSYSSKEVREATKVLHPEWGEPSKRSGGGGTGGGGGKGSSKQPRGEGLRKTEKASVSKALKSGKLEAEIEARVGGKKDEPSDEYKIFVANAIGKSPDRRTPLEKKAISVMDRLTQRDPFGRETGTIERRGNRFVKRDRFGRVIEEWDLDEVEDSKPIMQIIGDAVRAENTRMRMYDKFELADASVTFTKDGFMKAMPRIARTGIQQYLGRECGKTDMETVRVYRPADEVFKDSAWKTYTHLPVTLDHPPEAVTPANWKQYAVGETGEEVLRDGIAARVPMMLRDAAAIAAYKSGINQLSVGYDCDLDWAAGVTDSGEAYDAVQRNIRANHLAIVSAARGGPILKIGDDKQPEGDTTMATKNVLIDGIQCEMSDVAASVVQRTLTALQDQVENFKKKFKAEEEEKEELEDSLVQAHEAIKAKDAEIVTLKAQLKDAQDPLKLDAAVKDRAAVFGKARAILGDRFKMDGKTTEDIRREVVIQKLGDLAKGWGDAEIAASFNTLTADIRSGGGNGAGTIDHARVAFAQPGYRDGTLNTVDQAYADYDKELTEAWRNPGGVKQ